MKTIIAGGRDITEWFHLQEAIEAYWNEITEVVSGGATGVDALGERFARECGIPIVQFKADWKRYGKMAGPMRNREMAEYAEALLAIWDGESRGTANMIEEATKRGLFVQVHRI